MPASRFRTPQARRFAEILDGLNQAAQIVGNGYVRDLATDYAYLIQNSILKQGEGVGGAAGGMVVPPLKQDVFVGLGARGITSAPEGTRRRFKALQNIPPNRAGTDYAEWKQEAVGHTHGLLLTGHYAMSIGVFPGKGGGPLAQRWRVGVPEGATAVKLKRKSGAEEGEPQYEVVPNTEFPLEMLAAVLEYGTADIMRRPVWRPTWEIALKLAPSDTKRIGEQILKQLGYLV